MGFFTDLVDLGEIALQVNTQLTILGRLLEASLMQV